MLGRFFLGTAERAGSSGVDSLIWIYNPRPLGGEECALVNRHADAEDGLIAEAITERLPADELFVIVDWRAESPAIPLRSITSQVVASCFELH